MIPHTVRIQLMLPPWQLLISTFSLLICLFWTFHMKRIIRSVVFRVCLASCKAVRMHPRCSLCLRLIPGMTDARLCGWTVRHPLGCSRQLELAGGHWVVPDNGFMFSSLSSTKDSVNLYSHVIICDHTRVYVCICTCIPAHTCACL